MLFQVRSPRLSKAQSDRHMNLLRSNASSPVLAGSAHLRLRVQIVYSFNLRFEPKASPSVSAICIELHSSFHCLPLPCSRDWRLGRDRLPSRTLCRFRMFPVRKQSSCRNKGKGTIVLRGFQYSLFIPIVYSIGGPEHCTRRSIGSAHGKCICFGVVNQGISVRANLC